MSHEDSATQVHRLRMTSRARKWLFAGSSIVLFMAAVYSCPCMYQAACLFAGGRAVRNVHFWGEMMYVAVASSALFVVLAIRVALMIKRGG